MTRIEIHLTEQEVKLVDSLANGEGRSRKNFCETQILENKTMDDKYYKQQIEVLRRELKFHESEIVRIRSLITKYSDELSGFKKEKRENSGPYILHTIARARKKRDIEWIYNMLKVEKRQVKTNELCEMLNGRLDQPVSGPKEKNRGMYKSMTFAATLGKDIAMDDRFNIVDTRNDDNQRTKAFGLSEWKDDI
jgi:hypothetical protein